MDYYGHIYGATEKETMGEHTGNYLLLLFS